MLARGEQKGTMSVMSESPARPPLADVLSFVCPVMVHVARRELRVVIVSVESAASRLTARREAADRKRGQALAYS
jgi:hypothetical protein